MGSPVLSEGMLPEWRQSVGVRDSRLVVTNGCFDLLHVGHVRYLQASRALGDALLVGINDDASVKELKGPDRPLNPELDRAEVLAALACVDAVCIFRGQRATQFLEKAQPVIYAKGGDYTVDSLYAPEVDAVRKHSGEIHILPLIPGRSTTNLVSKIHGAPTRDKQVPGE